jgi:phosphoglycerate dehydrogenase-like enzyme
MSSAQQLRWVQLPAAGVERYLAIPGFVASDVVLTNAQRIFAPGGAEHVLAMVLALSRRLHTALSLQHDRRWDTAPLTGPAPYLGEGSELLELRDRTLLVVGLGGIGTEVARLAHGIGMRVIATRGSRREGPPFVEYVGLSSELLKLTPRADVIVGSVPFTPATDDMFGTEFFTRTKPTAFFVNIGRGRTVDTDALVQALRAGRIAGAGLDVTDPEPLPADHELWGMPNVIITPHVGGDSDGHMERLWLLFRENLRRFVNGEPLLSVVDKQPGY